MKNTTMFREAFVCLLLLSLEGISFGLDASRMVGNRVARNLMQPCSPYDSCERRCVKDSTSWTSYTNITIGHFNCFCDASCKTFGDCCLDYHTECVVHSQPKKGEPQSEQSIARAVKDVLTPRNLSFECVVVDQFSKGSYWMVTECANGWPQNDVKKKCLTADQNELDTSLPVLGETGWTYRNVYCAQCNYVKKFYYWALVAKCVRSAPEEVLSGDPDTMSFYLQHFCTTELQQDLIFTEEGKINQTTADIRHSLAWKKSLRSCEQNIISSCPAGYNLAHVINLCENYQSIIVKHDEDDPHKLLVFKNPMCALCHGYDYEGKFFKNKTKKTHNRSNKQLGYDLTQDVLHHCYVSPDGMSCPVWIWTMYYDSAFWKLDTSTESSQMLPSFNKNYKTSSWAPPSFSILMRFQENGAVDIKYSEDDSSSSVIIPAQENCGQNEIYDPFFGICRVVMCSHDKQYVEGKCVDQESNDLVSNQTDSNSAMVMGITITVSLVLPISPQTNYSVCDVTVEDIAYLLVDAFENVLNISAENTTVLDYSITGDSDTDDEAEDKNAADDSLTLSISFVVLEFNDYTEEDILQLIAYIGRTVGFDELLMTMDTYSVLVLEKNSPNPVLQCRNGTERIEYTSDEYELSNENKMLHVISTDMDYLEGEFQLLDWIISINGSGVEIGYMEQSRAVVCFVNATIEVPCDIYLPLNTSEYIELANGSLWLSQRETMINPDQYIDYQGGYAVCLDDFVPNSEQDKEELLVDPTDVIMAWVTFGLTIVSLSCLFFTFFTHCLFSELRSVSGWNTMNLTAALFAALLTFSVGATLTDPPSTCAAIAMLLHYLYLATFFWNNVMAFDVWLTFGKGIKQTFQRSLLTHSSTIGRTARVRRIIVKYMVYGWGMPAVVVACCAVAEFGFQQIHFGYLYDPAMSVCWISNPLSNVLAFGVPLAIILVANTVFFALSISAIHRVNIRKRRHSSTEVMNNRRKSNVSPTSPRIIPPTPIACDDNVFVFPEVSSESNSNVSLGLKNPQTKQPRLSVVSTKSHKTSLNLAKVNVLIYVKMSTVMGFTWAFGFLSSIFPDIAPLRYVFEVTVPLQGVFILVAFVCKRRIWNLYKHVCSRKTSGQPGTFLKSSKSVKFLDQCIKNRRKAQNKQLSIIVDEENVPEFRRSNLSSIPIETRLQPVPASESPSSMAHQSCHSNQAFQATSSPELMQSDYL